MAVTKIWSIRGEVETVIKYTTNDQKTWNQEYEKASQFHRIDVPVNKVMEYTADEMKTEKQLFVTGINCSQDPQIAARQFMDTKKRFRKMGGIICFHGYQSFEKGEVDAAKAHQIGVELARNLWGNDFEVLVSTHCNTSHFHNHFVLNSISMTDGHRYLGNKENYKRMKEASDRLCEKYRLSVLDTQNHLSKNTAGLGDSEKEGNYTIRQSIKDAIDLCIAATPSDMYDFIGMMKQLGFSFEQRGQFLRVKRNDTAKFWRLDRLGDTYSESDIKFRISMQWRHPREYGYTVYKPTFLKPDSLQKLYYHYCYLLGIFPKTRPERTETYTKMCADKAKIEALRGEAKMLADHHIGTLEQLQGYYKELGEEYTQLNAVRQKLKKKSVDEEEKDTRPTQTELSAISERIKQIRMERNYCIDIAHHSGGIEAAVRLIEFPHEQREETHLQNTENQKYRGGYGR